MVNILSNPTPELNAGSWETRVIEPRVIDVGRIQPKRRTLAEWKELEAVMPPPGSMVLYYATSESKIIEDLASALIKGGGQSLGFRAGECPVPLESTKVGSISALGSCSFNVWCRGKLVAEAVELTPGSKLGTLTFAAPTNPSVDQYLRITERSNGHDMGYQYLVSLQAQPLTAIERLVLGEISQDMFINVSAAIPGTQEAQDAVANAAQKMVDDAKKGGPTTPKEIQMGMERQLEELLQHGAVSTSASAHELMRIRQEYLRSCQ